MGHICCAGPVKCQMCQMTFLTPLSPRSKWTVKEWLDLGKRRACDTTELPKILHWPVEASPLASKVTLPEWLLDANWLSDLPGDTFKIKLQLVFDYQETGSHFDNTGADTWMKLLAGKVLVATWSFADAKLFGMAEFNRDVDWSKFYQMRSASEPFAGLVQLPEPFAALVQLPNSQSSRRHLS